jgi:hypothetical protein
VRKIGNAGEALGEEQRGEIRGPFKYDAVAIGETHQAAKGVLRLMGFLDMRGIQSRVKLIPKEVLYQVLVARSGVLTDRLRCQPDGRNLRPTCVPQFRGRKAAEEAYLSATGPPLRESP